MNSQSFLKCALLCVLSFANINPVWADPQNTIAVKNKDSSMAYVFFISKIYNKKSQNEYVLVPEILSYAQWKGDRVFPTPVSSIPYEVKIIGSKISIGQPLEKWPNTVEPGRCIWYLHENGTFKFMGKSPIHYGNGPQDYYCEPIKE